MINLSRALLFCYLLLAASLTWATPQQKLVLGVYAYQSKDKLEKRYAPFMDYLNQSVTGAHIEMRLLSAQELQKAIRLNQLDLIFTNPTLYEIIRNQTRLSAALATVSINRHGVSTHSLGGVIFTLANNTAIYKLPDLANRRIAIPSFSSTGAYSAPLFELVQRKIPTDKINFITTSHNDGVVSAVLSGEAEAGFVRTGILESWIANGKLNPQEIRIIHQRDLPAFPFMVSTRLYPEWPFAALADVDEAVIKEIAIALFSLNKDHPVSQAMNIAGFIPALDYLPLERLLKALKLFPYDQEPDVTWKVIWATYSWAIIAISALLVFLVGAVLYSQILSRRLFHSSENLKRESGRLEDIISATRVGTWEWDIGSGETLFNARWAEIVGYDLEDLKPFNYDVWKSLVHPEDIDAAEAMLKSCIEGERQFYDHKFRMQHKAGHWVWIHVKGKVVERSFDGKPVRMAGTHTDITVEKNFQEALSLKAERDDILLALPELSDKYNEAEFTQRALELIEDLTGSKISFIHFVYEDTGVIELVNWSRRTLESFCHALNLGHYDLSEAGIWANSVHTKKPFVVNDYASYADKKGLPEGHAYLERFISVPTIEQGQVVMMTGVGNKTGQYTDDEAESVLLIANEIWRLIGIKRGLATLQQERTKFHRLVNEIGTKHLVFSHSGEEGILSYVSDSLLDIFGMEAFNAVGHSWKILNWTDSAIEVAEENLKKILSGEEKENQFFMSFYQENGEERIARVLQHAVRNDKGELVSIDGLLEDVTESFKVEKRLKQAAKVFDYAIEGIMITDASGSIQDVNKAFTEISGYSREAVLGKKPRMFQSGHQDKDFYNMMWTALLSLGFWKGEIWNRRQDGEIYPQLLNISAIKDSDGNIEQYIAFFSDISLQKKQQQELERMAHYDLLTQLPNRTLLSDRIQQAMHYCNRHHQHLAVLFIDLDGFKAVNDQFGHESGDALLVEIAFRFKNTLRTEDTIARIGGDEFVGVVSELEEVADLAPLITRLLQVSNDPFLHDGNLLKVSSSIGVTFYPQYELNVDPDFLIRQADQAMYQAKRRGRNQVHFFKGEDETVSEDERIAEEIVASLEAGDFCLYYQPKVNVKTGLVTSLEALIRWQHPDKGFLNPLEFLPYIHSEAIQIKLDYWVLETALKQMLLWQQNASIIEMGLDSFNKINISVNVDASLIESVDFIDRLKVLLAKYPSIPASQLTLEVLETSAIKDVENISKVLRAGKKLGVLFAIDDFGVGYASLSYLRDLPVQELKVDQTFVREIIHHSQSLTILDAILAMGNAFNHSVTAEGVETDEHIRILRHLGYEVVQGYAISRPLPKDKVVDWLNTWSIKPEWQEIRVLDKLGKIALSAIIEQSAWLAKLTLFLQKNVGSLPVLSDKECLFSVWLENMSLEPNANAQALQKIQKLHLELHNNAKMAIQYYRSNEEALMSERLKKSLDIHAEIKAILEKHLA